MSEILSNTGVKLWAETDYSELWLTVFDQLTGQGGKSNIRLIDEAIGKINDTLDGYKFEFSSDEDRLYISKGDSKLPVSLIDSNGHVASKVDGTTITIDESGVVKGIPVDDALSEISTNPLQNKVIAGELKSIKSKIGTDESTIKSNTKRIEANETAISTLNGTGDGSVKKAVSDGIAKVVAGAPEDFDTLKEMSDWISTHETSASAMNSAIKDNKSAITALQIGKADKTEIPIVPTNVSEFTNDAGYLTEHQDISNLVVKEEGKGLSSNDYTSEEKTKLGGVGTSQGRNIIPYPYSQTTKTVYGVTFTDNKDGSIGISGTQDGSTSRPYMGVGIWWGTDKKEGNIKIDANTYFTISANCSSDNAGIRYYVYDESGSKLADNIVYGTATKTLKFDVDTWVALCIETAANSETYDCICKPQLELGTIAHAYEPSIESNVNLKKEIDKTSTLQGQNLIPYPYDGTEGNTNGITWTVNDDGSVTANGTASKEAPYSLIYPYNLSTMKSLQLGNTYIISDGLTDEQHTNVGYMQLIRYDKNNPTNWKYEVSSMKGAEIYTANDENTLQYGIRLIIRNGATANNITFKPMLEVGTMSHEYQPTTISNTSLNERLSDQQGQNLIPYPYDGTEGNTNGITWTVNDDGSVTANGTASKEAPYSLIYPYNLSTMKSLQLGNTYIISDGLTDEQHTNVGYMQLIRYDKNNPTNWKYEVSSMKGAEIYTANDENTLQYGIRLIIRNGATANNITFKPMLEVGTMSHEYQPTTISNTSLNERLSDQQGQNLIPYPYYRPDSYTNNGITWTVNEDGSVTANGTATATAHYAVFIGKLGLEIGKNYVLTITTVKGQASLYLANKNKQNINTDIAACRTVNNSTLSVIFKYSQTDDFDRDELGLYIVAGTTLTNCIIKFQLERGTIRHEYQPTTLSNPTLKKEIGSALQPESIVNNQTTTVAGFALDARQANPNIDGSLAKQISDLNGSLNTVFYAIKETKDANNADPGIARMPANSNHDTSTNNPFPNFHTILLTIPFVELSGGYAVQIGVSIAEQYNGKLAIRTKDAETWGNWNIIS